MKNSYTAIAATALLVVVSTTYADATRTTNRMNYDDIESDADGWAASTFMEEESSLQQQHPQCYNHGNYCEEDSDCWQGGVNYCTSCGNNRCYTPETPKPTPSPTDVGVCVEYLVPIIMTVNLNMLGRIILVYSL